MVPAGLPAKQRSAFPNLSKGTFRAAHLGADDLFDAAGQENAGGAGGEKSSGTPADRNTGPPFGLEGRLAGNRNRGTAAFGLRKRVGRKRGPVDFASN